MMCVLRANNHTDVENIHVPEEQGAGGGITRSPALAINGRHASKEEILCRLEWVCVRSCAALAHNLHTPERTTHGSCESALRVLWQVSQVRPTVAT